MELGRISTSKRKKVPGTNGVVKEKGRLTKSMYNTIALNNESWRICRSSSRKSMRGDYEHPRPQHPQGGGP